MRRLIEYPWPGNIRELENVIQRAMIMCRSKILEVDAELVPESGALGEDMPVMVAGGASMNADNDLNRVQRDHIIGVLREVNWVIEGSAGAALRLGMKPGTLRHRMRKLGIERDANLA